MLTTVAFDGDDTLWHNESIFSVTQEEFTRLVAPYVGDGIDVAPLLFATETRNLRLFGYGIKGFTLSMIETAIEVSGGRVSAAEIQRLIDAGKAMLEHPVELLPGADRVIDELAGRYRLMLITKGDLFDQESKLARSGLGERFWKIEIVSEKDEGAYARILRDHGIAPEEFVMVGNSMRSDVLPVLATGATAVHVPYPLTWAHELADPPRDSDGRFRELESLADLPALLAELDR